MLCVQRNVANISQIGGFQLLTNPPNKKRKCPYCELVTHSRNTLVLHWQTQCVDGPFIGSNVQREMQLSFCDFFQHRVKSFEYAVNNETMLKLIGMKHLKQPPNDEKSIKELKTFILNILVPGIKTQRDQW